LGSAGSGSTTRSYRPDGAASGAHAHSLREEIVIVLRGSVVARDGDESATLRAGEFVAFYPGKSTFHYLENTSGEDAELLVVSSTDKEDERDRAVFEIN